MSRRKGNKKKWNRVHYFQRKKSTPRFVGHPVYVYGARGNERKYLVFTHKPEDSNPDNYERLQYNFDPNEQGKYDSWVKKTYEVSNKERLREPDAKYRIHEKDRSIITKYKK